jgi:hypothetical protein
MEGENQEKKTLLKRSQVRTGRSTQASAGTNTSFQTTSWLDEARMDMVS